MDRVFATVAGEVAVVAVDHGQACAHVAGVVEGGDAGTERERFPHSRIHSGDASRDTDQARPVTLSTPSSRENCQ